MILCCGASLIDMLPRTSTSGETAFAPYPGGEVFNAAIALGRLGAPAGFLTGLSTDLFGTMLAEALAASGVDARLAPRFERPTTLAFVTLTGGQARYAFYDEGTAGRLVSEADLPALPDAVRAAFFGGIALAVEPSGTTWESYMRAASGRVVTMLDPNIRTSFIGDERAFRGRIERMIAMADIVKLSDEDLAWICGPGEVEPLARGLLGLGPKAVFVTEGSRGARAFTATGAAHVTARRVAVVDTVGAGDTFNAGILAALDRAGKLDRRAVAALTEADLGAALDLGARAAAVTVSRAGANPPWAHELG